MPSATAETLFVEGYRPGYLGRIVELHGRYYSKEWGSGAQFEGLMAIELSDFCKKYNPERDLLLTVHVDGEFAGSIAIYGSKSSQNEAQLRWFIIDEAYRGRGIGRTMLERALSFCREKGFNKVYLWTADKLPQSRHLYESVGFQIVEQFMDSDYGVPLLKIRMEMSLMA